MPFSMSISYSSSSSSVLVYASASGPYIYLLQRVVVSLKYPSLTSTRWYRPGGYFDYEIGGAQVEPSITILKVKWPVTSKPYGVEVTAHYETVEGIVNVAAYGL
jgi:hypothetical protein